MQLCNAAQDAQLQCTMQLGCQLHGMQRDNITPGRLISVCRKPLFSKQEGSIINLRAPAAGEGEAAALEDAGGRGGGRGNNGGPCMCDRAMASCCICMHVKSEAEAANRVVLGDAQQQVRR